MAETFPIKCGRCTEILDVAADIDPATSYNCPMCGAAIVIPEAEDFDLPCPAEVVIEEQTSKRLRFRLPPCLSGSNRHVIGVLYTFGSPVSFGVIYARWGDEIPLSFLLPLVFCCLAFFFVGLMAWRGSDSVDLSHGQITTENHLGVVRIDGRHSIETVKCVHSRTKRSMLWPFHGHVHYTCVGMQQRNSHFAESPNPDLARYVTHLIRRQLITMGHELQDG